MHHQYHTYWAVDRAGVAMRSRWVRANDVTLPLIPEPFMIAPVVKVSGGGFGNEGRV